LRARWATGSLGTPTAKAHGILGSAALPFDPQQIIARLAAEGVDFVVIGGVAATLHGAELPTLAEEEDAGLV
jgi:hypothetical protein